MTQNENPTFVEAPEQTMTILLCGVGGQGTILAADLLAKTASASGWDVKLSEIHGMAQRGGSVTTVVRMGKKVHSVMCDKGSADFILSFETTEAFRALPNLRAGGTMLVNRESIRPLPVLTGKASMPQGAIKQLTELGAQLIDASFLAKQAGSVKCANVVLMGALSTQLPFSVECWCNQIRAKVPPKTIDMNIQAFEAGRNAASAE